MKAAFAVLGVGVLFLGLMIALAIALRPIG